MNKINKEQFLTDQISSTKNFLNSGKNKSNRVVSLIDAALRHVEPPCKSKILCIGAREGTEVSEFTKRGFDAVGIDLVESDKVMKMDMHDMSFEDSRFSLVFACHSLEHSYDLHKALSEINRVLKARGALVLEVPLKFKNNKKIGDKIIYDLEPRFSGDVDNYDLMHRKNLIVELNKHGAYEQIWFKVRKTNAKGTKAKEILSIVVRKMI